MGIGGGDDADLHAAARFGDLSAVQLILSSDPLAVNCKDWHSRTPQEVLLLENEISFNEAIIDERDQGIQEIQQQISEVNELFKDLTILVHEQGAMIDLLASGCLWNCTSHHDHSSRSLILRCLDFLIEQFEELLGKNIVCLFANFVGND